MYLNCHTHFSFKYGTLSPQSLIEEAKRCNVHKLVLTDLNNTAGYIELFRICKDELKEYDLTIAMGIEFRNPEGHLLFIGIAQDNQGFEELCRFLSHHNIHDTPLPSRAPDFSRVFVIYQWDPAKVFRLKENEFLGVRIDQVNKIITSRYSQKQDRLVILHPVTFKNKSGFNVHRLLRAIDNNTILSKLTHDQQADETEVMHPEPELVRYFERYPQIVANTRDLLDQCQFQLDFNTNKNKRTFTGNTLNDHHLLKSLAYAGFERRYGYQFPRDKKVALDRLNKELEIIARRNFEAYF